MKDLFDKEGFFKQVSALIQNPYSKLISKIDKYINNKTIKHSDSSQEMSTQTACISEF